MIVVAWFIFIIFGLIILAYFDGGSFDKPIDYIFFVISAILTALSAGVLWGGLHF